jgi:hypothetical protein
MSRAPAPVSDLRTIVMNPASGSEGFPWAAVATILAAGVTGLFALIQLVISKENKISEFRHEWMDGLSKDVADYASSIRLYVELHSFKQRAQDQRMDSLFQETVNAQTRVQLRLRPKDKDHELLVQMGSQVEKVRASTGAALKARNEYRDEYEPAHAAYIGLKNALKANNPTQIRQAQSTYDPLLANSKVALGKLQAAVAGTNQEIELLRELAERVLDKEWTKVREGERMYQFMVWSLLVVGAAAAAVVMGVASAYLVYRLHWL